MDSVFQVSYNFEDKLFIFEDMVNAVHHYLSPFDARVKLNAIFGLEITQKLIVHLCSGSPIRIDPTNKKVSGIPRAQFDSLKQIGQFLSPSHIQAEMDATSPEEIAIKHIEMLGIGHASNFRR